MIQRIIIQLLMIIGRIKVALFDRDAIPDAKKKMKKKVTSEPVEDKMGEIIPDDEFLDRYWSLISDFADDPNYTGVVLKNISRIENGTKTNFFTSFTFASEDYLTQGDPEWLRNSGEPSEAFGWDNISSLVEFEVETDELYFTRKHISIIDLEGIVRSLYENKYFHVGKNKIVADIEYSENEVYKIGSSGDSIFKNANANLHRMSRVLVGWPANDSLFVLQDISRLEINGVEVYLPVSNLLGFLEYHIPKELCASVAFYFPEYSAWLNNIRLSDARKPMASLGVKDKSIAQNLSILYKASNSREALYWGIHKVDPAKIPTEDNQYYSITIDANNIVDTTHYILINDEGDVLDFSGEDPYVRSLHITMDIVGGNRKQRELINAGDTILKSPLEKRRAIVASKKARNVLFRSGDQSFAINVIKEIIDTARRQLSIMDPYFGEDDTDWVIFDEVASNIEIRLLTSMESRRGGEPANFATLLADHRRELDTFVVQSVYCLPPSSRREKCPFHDRVFIVDEKEAWSVGTSINGLGKRDSLISHIDSLSSVEVVGRFTYYWNEASPVHKELRGSSWTDCVVHKRWL